MKNKVVITGLGAVTPLGNSVADTWTNLLAGKSGVAQITRFPIDGFSTTIAAELKGLDVEAVIDRKNARRMDRNEQYCLVAAQMAFDDAGLGQATMDLDRCGAVVGSGIGGIATLEEQHRILMERGSDRISPFFVPMMIIDMSAGLIAIRFNFRGPNFATVSACASSAHAVAEAFRIIQRGEADIILSGGSEAAITPLSMAGFCAAKALSTRNHEPEKASRPFDAERDGFVMGEGSGMLVLESLASARARGARIYAEVVGSAMTCDAHHITAPLPDGSGAARAMKLALADAGIQPSDIMYVNSHGTATQLGDIAETKAIKTVFGDHAYKLAVNSTKSMTGHLLGAAGAVESIVTIKSIQEGQLHPTINLVNPDPECDLDYVPNTARRQKTRYAISNSFGFGGHNISLVFAAAEMV